MGGNRALRVFLTVIAWLLVGSRAGAEPLAPADVPEPLKPWTSWVLAGSEDERCPSFLGSEETTRCVWPAQLSLTLNEKGGTFEQRFHVDAKSWVPLPGDEERFPLDVTVLGVKAAVVVHEGVPSVSLPPGDQVLTGRFIWDSMPDSLAIPPETGVVQLTLGGVRVAEPSRDEGGRVWHSARSGA